MNPDEAADVPQAPALLRWARAGGLEHASVNSTADGYEVESVVVGPADEAPRFALTYRHAVDRAWGTKMFDVRVVGTGRRVMLLSTGDGRWRDDAGRDIPALRGCLDVDLTATPLTNTLPLRRLGLPEGGAAVVRVAHIEAPGLTPRVSEQRYTRPGRRTYRFELTDGSFARDITVDEQGFVLDYPGLFRRQDG